MKSAISEEMTARWIGFINNGVPSAKGYADWPEYSPQEKKVLYFGEEESWVKKDEERHEQTDFLEKVIGGSG